jgi:hypothetical protein
MVYKDVEHYPGEKLFPDFLIIIIVFVMFDILHAHAAIKLQVTFGSISHDYVTVTTRSCFEKK